MNRGLNRQLRNTNNRIKQLQKRTQVPQNATTRVYNDSGAQIDAGDVVYISGVDSGRPEISLASNAAAATYDSLLGVVPYDIPDVSQGYVIRSGYVRDIDTTAWAVGDELYLTAGGALTNARPATPIYVASVITVGVTDGVIFVNPKGADQSGGGGGWENITLWSGGSFTEYAFTEAGLIAANAAAGSGDTVFITTGTITLTATITIAAGVIWLGQSREGTIITYSGTASTMITANIGSVIDNMTINYTTTGTGSDQAIRTFNAIFRNLNVYANGNQATATDNRVRAIRGELYHEASASYCSVDNCYFKSYGETGYDNDYIIAAWLETDNGSSDYGTVVIKDSEFVAYTDANGWNTLKAADFFSYADDLILVVQNCVGFSYKNNATDGYIMEGFATGAYEGLLQMVDCTVFCYSPLSTVNTYGFNMTDAAILRNCYSYLEIDAAATATEVWAFATAGSDVYMHGCVGVSGTSNSSYGLQNVGADNFFYHCAFSGSTKDIFQDDAANAISVYACHYDDFDDDGGGITHLYGDRAGLQTDNIFTAKRMDTPEEITITSAGVAVSLTTVCTEITTNGDADLDNATLANGISGQLKHIYCVVLGNAGDTWKITPATMVGGSQITFSAGTAGEGCILRYADNEGWCVVGNNGGAIT
jgi:hypothetical protein